MKRIAFWAPMIFIAMMADQARSSETGLSALESCFKATRLSDAICSNPENPPQARIACYQKAQAAQLACLEHISPDVTASTPSTDTKSKDSATDADSTTVEATIVRSADSTVMPASSTAVRTACRSDGAQSRPAAREPHSVS